MRLLGMLFFILLAWLVVGAFAWATFQIVRTLHLIHFV